MRSYNRFLIDQEIQCRIEGAKDFVTLYNLSCGGCMIETANPEAEEGCVVEVLLGDTATMHGRIVWRIDRNAGVKFELPLHQSVIESLGFSGGMEEFDEYDPRDRFGLPLIG